MFTIVQAFYLIYLVNFTQIATEAAPRILFPASWPKWVGRSLKEASGRNVRKSPEFNSKQNVFAILSFS